MGTTIPINVHTPQQPLRTSPFFTMTMGIILRRIFIVMIMMATRVITKIVLPTVLQMRSIFTLILTVLVIKFITRYCMWRGRDRIGFHGRCTFHNIFYQIAYSETRIKRQTILLGALMELLERII